MHCFRIARPNEVTNDFEAVAHVFDSGALRSRAGTRSVVVLLGVELLGESRLLFVWTKHARFLINDRTVGNGCLGDSGCSPRKEHQAHTLRNPGSHRQLLRRGIARSSWIVTQNLQKQLAPRWPYEGQSG